MGPPAKRHLNGASLACLIWPNIEYWLGSFALLRGSRPVLLKKTICDFPGGVWTPSPLWIHKILDAKIVNIFLPISLTCFGCSNNGLIGTVLWSTVNSEIFAGFYFHE